MKQKLAVIYTNQINIWDNVNLKFHSVKKTVDEMSYAIPLKKAKRILAIINEDRKKEAKETGEHINEAYINVI